MPRPQSRPGNKARALPASLPRLLFTAGSGALLLEGALVDRDQALDVALGQIERQFGKGAVMKMNDHAAVSIGAISTGSLALDLALGIGGPPRGGGVAIFRPPASRKTAPRSHPTAHAQRGGRPCAPHRCPPYIVPPT